MTAAITYLLVFAAWIASGILVARIFLRSGEDRQ